MLRQTAGKESREKEGRTKRNREEKKRQECQLLVVGCVEVLHTEVTDRQRGKLEKDEKYRRVREEIRFLLQGGLEEFFSGWTGKQRLRCRALVGVSHHLCL